MGNMLRLAERGLQSQGWRKHPTTPSTCSLQQGALIILDPQERVLP